MIASLKEPLSDISFVESDNKSEDIFEQPDNDEQFSFDDLESLQDANIDNELLETCFINGHINACQLKFDKIARHSKTFGYVKLTEKSLKYKKKKLVKTWDANFVNKVKIINQKMIWHSKRIQDLDKVQEDRENETRLLLLTMEKSKLEALKNQKSRLIREQK